MAVEILLLGDFRVTLDGVATPATAWGRRSAAALVKLLALAPNRTIHREQVIDALWPDLALDDAAPRLHKAVHFARKALDRPDAIVVRGETIALFPDDDVTIDAHTFDRAAETALATGTREAAETALAHHRGDLLPHDPYEPWTETTRERLRFRHLQLLRQAQRWEKLVDADPTDEDAHLELMRAHAANGDRRAALLQYERLERTLARELGAAPADATTSLRDRLLATETDTVPRPAAPASTPNVLIGRDGETDTIISLLAVVAAGRGRTTFVSGPAGAGTSALLGWAVARAAVDGWRTGTGSASLIEGAWPYAAVLEALAGMCRHHPEVLETLDERYRSEIDRALSGHDLDWTGEASHQQLFVSAAALLRTAATDAPVLLVLDDLHEADEASLRLLHYLSRATREDRVLLLVGHRTHPSPERLSDVRESLLGRQAATAIELRRLDRDATAALVARLLPGARPETVERIWTISAGLPFSVVEVAREPGAGLGGGDPGAITLSGLDRTATEMLQRVATLGSSFNTDQFVALASRPVRDAYAALDAALDAGVIERTDTGYRFRHQLVRESLLDRLAPHQRRQLHLLAAERLDELAEPPARIAHHLLEAGDPRAAVPFALRAAERSAAVGAYRDALDLLAAVSAHARGTELAQLRCLRADLLVTTGDTGAIAAYREALETADPQQARLVRARLARTAMLAGERELAAAALDGLELDGGPADGPILLARGTVAYFTGDLEAADAACELAHRRVLDGSMTWHMLDLVALQGLIAHNRGEWFERLRLELRVTGDVRPELAAAMFDSHLCVAEYLLYGPTPYDEVIRMTTALRQTAERIGALRAVAFSTAVIGEAALLSGDLDRAQLELQEAVDLHHDIGATAGEAHSLQRLAELRLTQGDREGATALLHAALPLARWSPIAMHLLPRIHGSMILAAPDPDAARAEVDRATATLSDNDHCLFCDVMLAVPATIACADAGDLDAARRYLAAAEDSASRWQGTAWEAATLEARAHVVAAEGDPGRARDLLAAAELLFRQSGQPLDASRCAGPVAGGVVPANTTTPTPA
jgi:DNA-binding SARP family transcriptional activator/tetratricopeptide (TPR) repeat protein